MLLAIDIGNTNISAGLFKDGVLAKEADVKTSKFNAYALFFKKLISKNKIQKIIVCSVVPDALIHLNKKLSSITGVKVCVCGKDIIVPIKNLYKNPKHVGQDRLVNAYAGLQFYGRPLIMVDFGTAITFDVVSKHGDYLGGIIVPGIDISFDCLFERTALLPLVKFKMPNSLIGKDTVNSIRSGVVYGYASLCDGLIKRLKRKLARRVKVIATGGYAEFMAKQSEKIDIADRTLTLKGLNLLA